MRVVVTIQVNQKVNEVLSVLKKHSKVFPGTATFDEIYEWADSHINLIGDVKIVREEE